MNTTVDRTLTQAQWDELRYPVKLHPLSEEEGGGYLATIPLLGEATCVADGETVEEALANLEEYRRSLYDSVSNSRQPIPLPPSRPDEATARPAGKWLMRATPEIQAALQTDAAREGVSFNTYCLTCLERGRAINSAESVLRELKSELKNELRAEIACAVREEVHREVGIQMQAGFDSTFAHVKVAFENASIHIQPPAPAVPVDSRAASSQASKARPALKAVPLIDKRLDLT